MKLLIVTQKVDENDPILGFFHRWIEEFSKRFESVIVICLAEGQHRLPANVKVFSLGKEEGVSRFGYVSRFYELIRHERRNYDVVFVHMNPIYIVLGGLLWKAWGKKISLWYTHKDVDLKLRLAVCFANVVFTASRKSFNLDSKKVVVTGHGIDVDKFASLDHVKPLGLEPVRIVSVGRITPIKDPVTLVKALAIFKRSWNKRFKVSFIGAPAKESDAAYFDGIKALVSGLKLDDTVEFIGNIAPKDMPQELAKSDVSVNLCPTGGIDKVVLEAMAAGVLVMVANQAFREYLGPYEDRLTFKEHDAVDLAGKLEALIGASDSAEAVTYLLNEVRRRADLKSLILKIADTLSLP